jgi:hypothetical protein
VFGAVRLGHKQDSTFIEMACRQASALGQTHRQGQAGGRAGPRGCGVHDRLRELARESEGREREPSAAVIDSQTARASGAGGWGSSACG